MPTKIHGTDPETGEQTPLFNPRKDKWLEHFAWDETLLYMMGLTPVGRTTIQTLKTNRDEIRYIRRAVMPLGDHPPDE
ncbi:MAG: hypothetical protein AAF639_12630 [Chloroflexota bacterium]